MDERLKIIGVIHTPYKTIESAPYQGRFADEVCKIEVFKEYERGLKDIEQASHLIVLYWLDKANREVLLEHTPHDTNIHGVFATRSQNRPNPIGFSVVELIERKGNILKIKGIDALDKTPLLDIKPYSSEIDAVSGVRIGWYEKARGDKR